MANLEIVFPTRMVAAPVNISGAGVPNTRLTAKRDSIPRVSDE